jgi:uncharacterized OB-fold protein
MTRVVIEPGIVELPNEDGGSPRLLGSRCDACGAVFHPARPVCLACYARSLSNAQLEGRGVLYACTHVQMPLRPSQRAGRDYWVAQVDLDDGPRVQGLLSPDICEPQIGMRLRLALEILRIAENGDEIVAPHFCAEDGAA